MTHNISSSEICKMPRASGVLVQFRLLLSNQLGITGLQFAMLLPALLGAVMGAVEMGRMLMAQNTLVHAANEATRYAMVRSASADTVATEGDVVTFVKGRMTGLDTSQAVVNVNWTPDNQPGGRVTVDVDYPYTLSALGMGSINLRGSSSMFIAH